MQQKNRHNTRLGWTVTLAGAALLLAFFLLLHPYHLRHREQTMLFLMNAGWIRATYLSLEHGGLVRLAGDFLQQFFYYIGAGPAIVSVLLTMLGVVWYRITNDAMRLLGRRPRRSLAYAVGILVTLWEAGRECLPEYPLASTLQVTGWSLVVLVALQFRERSMAAWALGLGIVAGCWLFDYELLPQARLFGKPDMTLEHLFRLDVEASFGHWDEVEQLTREDRPNNIDCYYRNLALAHRQQLPEALMSRPQNGGDGLFIPVDERGNYFLFAAAGEAWWAVGDLTMAEHATLLGQIFSPRKVGSRCMKRLAEINLAKGDKAGAEKYLRMLKQTIAHGSWAARHTPDDDGSPYGPTTEAVATDSDTLRLAGEVQLCLRSTLDRKPDQTMARQYLLCYDLLACDLLSFASDVERYGCPRDVRLYEEAMLVVMASRPELREAWQPRVRRQTYDDFEAFNRALIESQGHLEKLGPRFGKTYWYHIRKKVRQTTL